MKKCWTLAIVTSLLFVISIQLQSQTTAPPPATDHWWNKSAFAAQDSLNRILFHAEGELSLNKTTGNFESHMFQSGGEIDVRKGLVTGSINVKYRNQQTKDNNQETSMEYLLASGNINWDILPFLTGDVGVLWEKDEQRMMRNQYLPYLGVGTRWAISSAHQLNLFIAGGRAFPTYTIPISYFGMEEGAYNGMYISQYYHFDYSRELSFEETIVHLRNLNETKRYSTNISFKLSFALSQHLKIMIQYSHALSTEAGFVGASEVDTGQLVGINLSI